MDGARVLETLTSICGTNGMCTTTLSGAPFCAADTQAFIRDRVSKLIKAPMYETILSRLRNEGLLNTPGSILGALSVLGSALNAVPICRKVLADKSHCATWIHDRN
jgi:hypothetical protein